MDGSTMQIHAAGIPGRRYRLQAAIDLAPPVTWTDLGPAQLAPTHGRMLFQDPDPQSPRFYRVQLQSP
jgi:hypothetical protein